MSNEQKRTTAFKLSARDSRAEPSRNYARVPGYKKKKKDKKKTKKEKKNQRRRNPYARVRRYKITSTLILLLRGDPQDEGLRRLQPRARLSKLDYFYAGITSTRLHRSTAVGRIAPFRTQTIILQVIYTLGRNDGASQPMYLRPSKQPRRRQRAFSIQRRRGWRRRRHGRRIRRKR